MKYTIEGFSQAEMVKLGMDCTDAVMLRWFVDFAATGKMRYLDRGKRRLFWLKYGALVGELPVLGVDKQQVARRLKAMVASGVLIHEHVLEGGSFSYYGFGDRYEKLVSDGVPSATDDIGSPTGDTGEVPPKAYPCAPQDRANDSSTSNESTRINDAADAGFEAPRPVHPKRKGKQRSPEDVALHHEIGDMTVKLGGHWVAGGKEGKALWEMIDWAHLQDNGHGADLLRNVFAMAWALHEGEAPDMTKGEKQWWQNKGFTPSFVKSQTPTILQHLRRPKEEDFMDGLR